jgi:hypothetical protein
MYGGWFILVVIPAFLESFWAVKAGGEERFRTTRNDGPKKDVEQVKNKR